MQYGLPRQKTVAQDHFAIAPMPGVQRSVFTLNTGHKTTFDSGELIPVYCTEVLPGDSYKVQMTALARLAPTIRPIMDNMYLDSFFFFVPYRLLWTNWKRFMGERDPNTSSSIDYLIPQVVNFGGASPCTIYDYMGIPGDVQVTQAPGISFNSLPFRAYNLIYNEWFRDENLQNKINFNIGDGPDTSSWYAIQRRGKRYDYFTSGLPWAQKGDPVLLPLGATAPVRTLSTNVVTGAQEPLKFLQTTGAAVTGGRQLSTTGGDFGFDSTGVINSPTNLIYPSNLYADLSQAAAATVNTVRTAVALQQFLERDARGGTRYTEIIRSHFGVQSPDSRLQRPEYLGGGSSPVYVNPVAQTSETGTTPLGTLAGVGTAIAEHGFSQSFTEHGVILGIVSVRADLNYQQGLPRMYSRRTRHDFFWPEYAHLGEQTIPRKEIFATGDTTLDETVFAYQERYAEYRFDMNKITGMFKSNIPGTLDFWHLAQNFGTNHLAPPVLGSTFIQETPPMDRILAAGALATDQQFLFDSVFSVRAVRPIPMYGTPGLTRL